ncbi:MAG: hypothetical protein H6570_20700 [Lewinellaceae bacterium]|nr:hypothetical protein [Lewinellaceae bacterium]
MKNFIYKREEVHNIQEAFEYSRLSQILKMTKNITKTPVYGIGFALPSNHKQLGSNIVRDPILNLPVSSPTEKGFLPFAIIEETGIVGSFFFIFIMYFILHKVLNTHNSSVTLVCLSAILSNIGEMYFFSFGGMGLIMWLLIGQTFSPSKQHK